MSRFGWPLRLALIAILAGCAAPAVSAPPSSSPGPSPTIDCASPRVPRGALDCRAAVAAAIAALPAVHRPLRRVEFAYGAYCGWRFGCGQLYVGQTPDLSYPSFQFGLVSFMYQAPQPPDWVYVVTGSDGKPALGGCIRAWPPDVQITAQPTPMPSEIACSEPLAR